MNRGAAAKNLAILNSSPCCYTTPFAEENEALRVNQKQGHSGIYLLPNLLTTASLFAAFYSMVSSLNGQYESAVIAIFIGMVMDGLDGRIARLTNTQTDFGAEYDSLSDMVTFGVAPALLLYSWDLHQLGKLGWLVSFMFTASVALRLARFNTQLQTADKAYFQGLACPAGAALVCSFAWLCYQQEWTHFTVTVLTAILTVFASLLMVSNVRYHSFKQLDFKGKVPFLYVLLMVILFMAIAVNPSCILFTTSLAYASSGPFQTLLAVQAIRKKRRKILKSRQARDNK
jgi:CDP-diacylglycerol--serine O-phosphatidyltransferase